MGSGYVLEVETLGVPAGLEVGVKKREESRTTNLS